MCERRLKSCKKCEKIPTEWIPKSSIFDRSSIYQSWTFDPKKCVFDRFLGERRRYVFAKLTDPVISTGHGCLDCATQKVCPRRAAQWQNAGKSVAVVVGGRTLPTSLFKRRPHKMPFGQKPVNSASPQFYLFLEIPDVSQLNNKNS